METDMQRITKHVTQIWRTDDGVTALVSDGSIWHAPSITDDAGNPIPHVQWRRIPGPPGCDEAELFDGTAGNEPVSTGLCLSDFLMMAQYAWRKSDDIHQWEALWRMVERELALDAHPEFSTVYDAMMHAYRTALKHKADGRRIVFPDDIRKLIVVSSEHEWRA
jgi:hypothetical protein